MMKHPQNTPVSQNKFSKDLVKPWNLSNSSICLVKEWQINTDAVATDCLLMILLHFKFRVQWILPCSWPSLLVLCGGGFQLPWWLAFWPDAGVHRDVLQVLHLWRRHHLRLGCEPIHPASLWGGNQKGHKGKILITEYTDRLKISHHEPLLSQNSSKDS